MFENAEIKNDTDNLQHVCVIPNIHDSQYSNIIYYLIHDTAPFHLDIKKKPTLRIKDT
jgi:hypothetical protein